MYKKPSRDECSRWYNNTTVDPRTKHRISDTMYDRYKHDCSSIYNMKMTKLQVAKRIADLTGIALSILMKHLKSTLVHIYYTIKSLPNIGQALTVKECTNWRRNQVDPRTGRKLSSKEPKFLEYAQRCQIIIKR